MNYIRRSKKKNNKKRKRKPNPPPGVLYKPSNDIPIKVHVILSVMNIQRRYRVILKKRKNGLKITKWWRTILFNRKFMEKFKNKVLLLKFEKQEKDIMNLTGALQMAEDLNKKYKCVKEKVYGGDYSDCCSVS